MATAITLKAGDTFPYLRLTASDVAGLLPVKDADKIEFFMKNAAGAKASGVMEVLDPPVEDAEGEERNLEYKWNNETALAGTWKLEVKITWDEAATPDSIQHVPNTGTITITIEANNE